MHKINKKIMCSFLALMALNASNGAACRGSSDGFGSPSVSIRSSICPSGLSALRIDNDNLDDLHLCFPSGESSDADSTPSSKDKSSPKASMQPEFTDPTASSSSGNPTTNIASFKLNPEAAEFIPQYYKFSNSEQLSDLEKKKIKKENKKILELAIKRIENCLRENEENETAKRIKDEILKKIKNYLNRIQVFLKEHGISRPSGRTFRLAKIAAADEGSMKKLRSLLNKSNIRDYILIKYNQNHDDCITHLINQLEKVLDEIERNPNAQMSSNPEPRPKLTPMPPIDPNGPINKQLMMALNLEPSLKVKYS